MSKAKEKKPSWYAAADRDLAAAELERANLQKSAEQRIVESMLETMSRRLEREMFGAPPISIFGMPVVVLPNTPAGANADRAYMVTGIDRAAGVLTVDQMDHTRDAMRLSGVTNFEVGDRLTIEGLAAGLARIAASGSGAPDTLFMNPRQFRQLNNRLPFLTNPRRAQGWKRWKRRHEAAAGAYLFEQRGPVLRMRGMPEWR